MIGFLITLAFGFLIPPLTAEAQPSAKAPRIGWLSQGSPPSGAQPNLEAFREELRVPGWVEGQNLVMEYRWAGTRDDRLPALAAELIRLPVDVIFATPDVAAHAAKNATTIPMVFRGYPDPVGWELITSLARPGGNITGLSTMLTELSGKRLELLKEAVPGVTRVAVLWNPASPRHTQPGLEQTLAWTETPRAAHALGVQLQWMAAEGPDAFDRAFAAMTRERAEALVVLPHALFGAHRRRLIALAAERRLPMIYWRAFFTEDGALMAYGPNLRDEYRRAVAYVDKILKGTKPGDPSVEQPTTFELVINLETAQALGDHSLIAPLPGDRGDLLSLWSSCVCARRSSLQPGESTGHMVAFQRFEVGHNGTLRASSGRPTTILKEAPEVMSRDREHTMSQSAAIPAAAVYRNVRTEDQGNSGSMPTHPQSCQAMTARDAENWRADAQHTERYVVRRVAR